MTNAAKLLVATLLLIVLFAGALFVFQQSVLSSLYHDQLESCHISNRDRLDARVRGSVDKQFMLDAARVRAEAAVGETNPRLRRNDIRAAIRYRALASQILPVRLIDCDHLVRKPPGPLG